MKAADLYRLIEDPSLLTKETLPQLQQIVEEYPYFQIARMLYLKNLAVLNDIRFAAELKRMAVYIPDRRKLFTLIEGERYGMSFKIEDSDDSASTDSFSLIDAFLADRENGGESQPTADSALLFQPSVSSDYIYWSLSKEEEEKPAEEPSTRLQHQDLIDSFIKNDEQRVPGSGLAMTPQPEGEEMEEPLKEPEQQPASLDDDSYFTETLAHIYVKQKRYEKALQIIKNLYLNYPEKNAYFADQIRFLEKLIINTKK